MSILKLLAESTGNILDDEELISTLQESKTTSAQIKIQMVESDTLNKSIDEIRDKYRSTAVRGALLYFVISDLPKIDPMYQFSL
jgi:dynein heavy chain